jgi:hypothetical protein
MVLGLFVLLFWVMLIFYLMTPKSLSIIENIILFMLNSLLVVNIFTIITLNFHLMNNSQQSNHFLAFIIYRTLIIQFGLLLFTNLMLKLDSVLLQVFLSISFLFVFNLLQFLTVLLQILDYVTWNTLDSNLMFSGFMIASYAFGLLLKKWRLSRELKPW